VSLQILMSLSGTFVAQREDLCGLSHCRSYEAWPIAVCILSRPESGVLILMCAKRLLHLVVAS
jgi:hypothetical protein